MLFENNIKYDINSIIKIENKDFEIDQGFFEFANFDNSEIHALHTYGIDQSDYPFKGVNWSSGHALNGGGEYNGDFGDYGDGGGDAGGGDGGGGDGGGS